MQPNPLQQARGKTFKPNFNDNSKKKSKIITNPFANANQNPNSLGSLLNGTANDTQSWQ
jgi:hypothetical protein